MKKRHNYKPDIVHKIETRIKTTMIGSLAKFEEAFGELLEQSDEYSDLWYDVRTKILNNGNHQIRLAAEDLENYIYNSDTTLSCSNRYKYNYKFYPQKDRRQDED